MSYPLTISVSSMSHPHVNSHYHFSSAGTATDNLVSSVSAKPSPISLAASSLMLNGVPIMMPPPMVEDGEESVTTALPERVLPTRKQSVFVAPSGLKAIHLPGGSNEACTLSNSPLDLSEAVVTQSTNSQHSYAASVITPAANGARGHLQTAEHITQHIAKLISNNKAIIDSCEAPPALSRHYPHLLAHPQHNSHSFASPQLQQQTRRGSLRQQSCSISLGNIAVDATTARGQASQEQQQQQQQQQHAFPVPVFTTYQSPTYIDAGGAPNRRYSSVENVYATNDHSALPSLSYSKLHSALLGEAAEDHETSTFQPINKPSECSPGLVQLTADRATGVYRPSLYPIPRHYSMLNNTTSVIVSAPEMMIDRPPSPHRSSSESSLVRNLLTSKTCSLAHLSTLAELNTSSQQQHRQQASTGQSDGSIIKDLLLNSRTMLSDTNEPDSVHKPPRKKSRTQSLSESQQQQQQHSSSALSTFACSLCQVTFRNRQNLEVHQMYYCRGKEDEQQQPATHKRFRDETNSDLEAKKSLQERPSIISFNSELRPSSSLSNSSTISSILTNELVSDDGNSTNYGNILKSKLLDSTFLEPKKDNFLAILANNKRRKTSEPAMNYNYGEMRQARNEIRTKRSSVIHPPTLARLEKLNIDRQHLEILPAYMPYLIRPSIKITLKLPIVFSSLTSLIERGMNHEFVVNTFIPSPPIHEQVNRVSLLQLPSTTIKEDKTHHELESIVQELVDRVELNLAFESDVVDCVEDVLEKVIINADDNKELAVPRPTTLSFSSSTTYEQSIRHKSEILALPSNSRTLYLNRRSTVELNSSLLADWPAGTAGFRRGGGMVASTLVSPDTPRAQRKYQQVHLNGAAYTNLCLKVTTPPTFCCIYSPFPMTVQQEAVPQLSFYSEWRAQPVPAGDILELVGSARALLAAYDSREAVAQQQANKHALHFRLVSLEGGALAQQAGGGLIRPAIQPDANKQVLEKNEEEEEEANSITNFLDRITTRLHNLGLIDKTTLAQAQSTTSEATSLEHIRHIAIVPSGQSTLRTRVVDTSVSAKYILTHSNYHQQRASKHSKKSRTELFCRSMVIAASGQSSNVLEPHSDQSSDLGRKRSLQANTTSFPSITTASFYNLQNPLLGHLPNEQVSSALMYLMMSQTAPAFSVPRVSQMIESINLAARKFSECIGMRQPAAVTSYEENWTTRICSDGHTEMIPKRIKIFEGGFKSNEDYTYVRGRGRGKYVCEDCGIRCKKPSMLKKHIRTHTDLRPYSCRHCAFAFKTKGNLTKHMKSKAHHKKCVEMGIVPVPTAIDDTQIDSEALAKQEQYELAINGGLGQFADDDDDGDEEFYDEEEDDEDDEGVPIPMVEQQRLTYITPGQFDDADASETIEKTRKLSTNSSGKLRKLSHLSSRVANNAAGDIATMKSAHDSKDGTGSMTTPADKSPPSLSSASVLSMSANNVSNETISNGGIQTSSIVNSSKIISNSSLTMDNDHKIENNETIDRQQGLSSLQTSLSGSSVVATTSAHAYDEAEAVRSLLILSGLSQQQQQQQSAPSLSKNIDRVRKSSTAIDESHQHAKRKVSFKDDPIVMHRSPPGSNHHHYQLAELNRTQQQFQHQQQLLMMQQMASGQTPVQTIKVSDSAASSFPTSVIIANDKSRSLHQVPAVFALPSNDSLQKPEPMNGKMHAAFIAENIQRQAILLQQQQQQQQQNPTLLALSANPAFFGTQTQNMAATLGKLYEDCRLPGAVAAAALTAGQFLPNSMAKSNGVSYLAPAASQLASLNANFGSAALSPISLEDNYTKIIEGSLNARANQAKKEGLALQLAEKTTGYAKPNSNACTASRTNHHSHNKSSSPNNLFNSLSGPLPLAPCSPLVAPELKTRRPRTTCTNTSLERPSLDDQPMDLSRKTSTSASPISVEANSSPTTSPSSSMPATSSPVGSKRCRSSLDERVYYRPPLSALSSLDMQTFPKFPLPSSTHHPQVNNGRELYNALRSEEFYHKTPGVHSPNRLPSRLSASVLSPSTPSLVAADARNQKATGSTAASPFTSEGKSVCTVCAKQFSKPSQLRLHINIHFFERPFRCEACAVSFRTKGHLQKHSRSVSHLNKMNMNNTFGRASDDNPRPFKCTDCKIAFRIHGHLAKHLRSKMHIMKLECLGKLPFGMYAEMERSNINLNLIDTTNCAKAHESLRTLAETLYDPRKMTWKPPEELANNEEEEDDDDDDDGIMEDGEVIEEEGEDFSEEEEEMMNVAKQHQSSSETVLQPIRETFSASSPPKIVVVGEEEREFHSPSTSSSSPPLQQQQSVNQTSVSPPLAPSSLISTRSNTCNICGRLFKAAKFLQVHLYQEHPDAVSTSA